jgi:hypothetical protein
MYGSDVIFTLLNHEFNSLKLQGLWPKILCDNLVAHTIDYIQCNRRTIHMNNINYIISI